MEIEEEKAETAEEAAAESETPDAEKEQEERIRKLFEDRNANEEMHLILLHSQIGLLY